MRFSLSGATLVAVAVLACNASTQFNGTVGPTPAPLGCPISITISIDWQGRGSTRGCPYRVFDDQMNLIYDPRAESTCGFQLLQIGPWGWNTSYWNQIDQTGHPVPAGDYWIEVFYDISPSTMHLVQVGGATPGVVLQGTATIHETLTGESRRFWLCAPGDAGYPYWLLLAFGATSGIPTCGGTLPLNADSLLVLSTTPSTPVLNSLGTLSADGTSNEPRLDLPPIPGLIGLPMHAAFLVLDSTAPCVVRRIFGTHAMTIIG